MTSPRWLPLALCGALIWTASDAHPQTAKTPPPVTELYLLEQHGGGLGVLLDQSVRVLAVEDPGKDPQFVIERQRRDRNWCGSKSADGKCVATDVTTHDWAASSRTCPFLDIIVEGFSDFRETGREHPPIMMTDTPLTTLEFAPAAADGKPPHILSEYVGPVAAWWRDADHDLKTCWTTTPPVIDGYSLEARLTTTNR
jgi:hypothetical protein